MSAEQQRATTKSRRGANRPEALKNDRLFICADLSFRLDELPPGAAIIATFRRRAAGLFPLGVSLCAKPSSNVWKGPGRWAMLRKFWTGRTGPRQPMTAQNTRQSDRAALSIDIEALGAECDGREFVELARTLLISRTG